MTIERIEAPDGMMVQWAPYPMVLAELVGNLDYKPDWSFKLIDTVRDRLPADPWWTGEPLAGGLTFIVTTHHVNAYHPEQLRPVNHLFPVPAATFNRDSWQRWILDRLLDVDMHEACEWTVVFDGEGEPVRPFAPTHGPGDNPYRVVQYATDEQRRTAFTGTVKEA